MGKDLKISLEAFGNKRLTVMLRPEEIKGKSVSDVVNQIINKKWEGDDKHTLAMIRKEIDASGGYVPSIEVGDKNLPVRAQPIKLGDRIEKYVTEYNPNEQGVTLAVTGNHIVGYRI